jgi:hypothetical protein
MNGTGGIVQYLFYTFRFCPSVFFYLLSVVPAIWFLELDELKKRINIKNQFNSTSEKVFNESSEELHASLEKFGVSNLVRLKSREIIQITFSSTNVQSIFTK